MLDATGILARWPLQLSELVFDFMHKYGIKNRDTSALPRIKNGGEDSTDINYDLPLAATDPNKHKSEAIKVSSYTVEHVCDHGEQEPGTIMLNVQALVQ